MTGPNCRWCQQPTDAEFVGIGLGGHQQVTGGVCDNCGAVEMSPYRVPDGRLTEEEMATYWHAPFEDHPDYSPYSLEGDGTA